MKTPHLKRLDFNFTISRDVGGYRIRFESVTQITPGGGIFWGKVKGMFYKGSLEKFEKSKTNDIDLLLSIYAQKYPNEMN